MAMGYILRLISGLFNLGLRSLYADRILEVFHKIRIYILYKTLVYRTDIDVFL